MSHEISESKISAAIRQLERSSRGVEAGLALRDFPERAVSLDELNQRAILDLVAEFFAGRPGTVRSYLSELNGGRQ
jgi:hypothetical protein